MGAGGATSAVDAVLGREPRDMEGCWTGVRAREKEAEESGETRTACAQALRWGLGVLGPSGQCQGRQVRALGLCCPSAL